ncbi:Lipopolysaccharide biosynthesis regulator YciM, contains six TPR domains and a predicted metal-binding C-terminal domain [Pelagirhabdus alkalitolerans]|uniref:Lipopolysaccharide biosynthesis regulator YciM, contains six TPR domains and a predicted metal-binding C-terminal domain n=1 Tax=Pelagirhabdus alkalitolerans TaxID=1612202 RepID=A0A1G6HAD4_9BACI|nr:tetratricopeptide repeat protein [Pelagirhabdus alkalitolerans]SDB91230.1 Lipopolysaccharide biosynthesis regulator YciM, contains six TPR domains and a predicted metal-binding C-terminal domain [Pelagirhabdus alkalitolerans]
MDIYKAIHLIEEGETDQGIKMLQDLAKDANEDDLFTIADLFLDLGLTDDAKPILEKLLTIYPTDTELIITLAELYTDLEEDQKALDLLETIDSQSTDYVLALLQKADLYQSQGLFEVAEQKLMEAKQLAPNEYMIDFALAELAFSNGHYQAALTHYEKVYKQERVLNQVDISQRLAESYAALGEFEQSIEWYQSVEIDDDDTLFRYGFIAFQANRLDIAVHNWEKLINNDPSYTSVYPYLAEAYDEQGMPDEGYRVAKLGIEQDSLNKELLLTAAGLARKVNQSDESYRLARESIAIDPGYKEGVLYLVENYKADGDFEAIIDLLSHIIDQGEEDGYYKWELAKAYEEEESFNEAYKAFQQAYDDFKDDADFLKSYGYFLVEEGKIGEAISVFKRYLSFEPSDSDLEQYLMRLES